jgi:hypothetical protein
MKNVPPRMNASDISWQFQRVLRLAGLQNFEAVPHEFAIAGYESPNVKHDPGLPVL